MTFNAAAIRNFSLALTGAMTLSACASLGWGGDNSQELTDVLESKPATEAPAETPAPAAAPFVEKSVTSEILGREGAVVGDLTAESAPGGVLLRVRIDPGSLSPGWHGLHLHQVPDCSDMGFKLSGGHVGKHEGGHGLKNPAGPEAGDLPNIYASRDGSAAAEMYTALTTFPALEAAGGFAMVIHEGPDDQITQPIGGAGARVACSAIKF